MSKVILSTDESDTYLFFLPITVWAWKMMGYDSIVFMPLFSSNKAKLAYLQATKVCPNIQFVFMEDISGYKQSTMLQCSRMYAGCLDSVAYDEYLLMGDIDMLPLSEKAFEHDQSKINYMGHDLTDFNHIPMCYVGMKKHYWQAVMNYSTGSPEKYMKADLDAHKENWGVDQDILTDKMRSFGLEKCNSILRGKKNNGQAIGRVCRAYGFDIETPNQIDAHLPRPGYEPQAFANIVSLIKRTCPQEHVQWIIDYKNEYVRS